MDTMIVLLSILSQTIKKIIVVLSSPYIGSFYSLSELIAHFLINLNKFKILISIFKCVCFNNIVAKEELLLNQTNKIL